MDEKNHDMDAADGQDLGPNRTDVSMSIHRDDAQYFNALVDARSGAELHRRRVNGTAAGSLANLFRGVGENASRRFAEGKQRLAA